MEVTSNELGAMCKSLAKTYADACVQTSPVVYATQMPNISDTIRLTPQQKQQSPSRSIEISNSNKAISYGLDSKAKAPQPRTPLKAISKNTLSFALPSQHTALALQESSKRRIVSLPTKASPESTQEKITRSILIGTRSVSMPGAYRHFATVDSVFEGIATAQDSPSFSIGPEGDSRMHESLRSVGLPETPSPPSSPDSILIIENNSHLPDTFLHTRRKPTLDTGKCCTYILYRLLYQFRLQR